MKIFHTNDEHGRLKTDTGRFSNYVGFEAISEFLSDKNRDLLISAGDLIQGLPLSDFDKGETISKIAKHLKYDSLTIGNHEFDFGLEHIKKLNEYNSKLDNGKASPFLSANIYYKDYEGKVAPANYDQSKVGQRVFKPYLIKNLENGLKVAIIAITTPDTAYTSSPKNSVLIEFRDPVTEAKKVIAEIKQKENVDLIIATTHLGIGRDRVEWDSSTLISKVKDIDLLIDGHSHTYIPIKNQKYVYDKRYLTQTEAYSKYIGEIDIVFDTKTKTISRVEQSLRNVNEVLVANANYTSEVIRLLEDLYNVENNIELFTTEQSFRHTEDVVIGGNTYISGRTKATPLGVLWANSLAHAATLAKFWEANSTNENLVAATLDNHIALVNGGGLRVDLKTGKIKKGDLVAIAPFGNNSVTLKVNGTVLKQAITHGLQKGQTGGFSQLSSNVSYEAIVEKTLVQGSKKYQYKVKKIQINGKDIDENQIYYITTNDFISIGGDGYTMLNLDDPGNKNKIVKVLELNSQVEIFTSYFEKYQNPNDEAKKELFGYQVNEVNKPEFLAKQKIIFPAQ
ncbi:5'-NUCLEOTIDASE PRECURSOR [Mycoplasmopsis pulmonis]|uniref:5'-NUCLEOTIDASE n=1 Tax=Mycoplasmopsis pulmonis (strain UAB CTIP) TaxID=272635 RepID=Q98RF4_MYCPU|nr:bifunctional UDP-sugar hydrolase/5'-nucleotidase [Mycoplasmopsis pulmonis]CAC13228.1 5'-NUCLEOTIDASE PRECURSOR [Mycoplasmopsis pulmonis]